MDTNIKLLLEGFIKAVERVKPYKMIKNFVSFEQNILKIKMENKIRQYKLDKFDRIYVFAIGKAAFNMAYAIEDILGNKITRGIVLTKYGHVEKNVILKNFDVIEAGHPVPDKNSLIGANKIYSIAKNADKKTLVINLISGGGSSLFTLPDYDLSLEDIQKATQVLLESGATITEINSIRKHISKVKGGKFAKACFPAQMINIILSDVIGDRLDSIASGIAVADDTTFKFVYNVIKKYKIENKLPAKIIETVKKGVDKKIEDTPKRNDIIFSKVENILLGNNYSALIAAKKYFENQTVIKNLNSYILTSHLSGEAKEIAKFFSSIAIDGVKELSFFKKPFVLITGGETTVTIKGNGKGGRNQEMVLSFLIDISKYKEIVKDKVYFLSAGTDGNDGPTDAAGAYFESGLFNILNSKKLNPEKYLNNNDSYNFFNKINALIKSGPTNTNVCDIQILLVL